MKDLIKSSLILLLICVLAATALGFTNEITKNTIASNRFLKGERAKAIVLSEAKTFKELADTSLVASETVKSASVGLNSSGEEIGIVVFVYPNGYGGELEVIIGLDFEGRVTGLRIGSHTETPGLGDKSTKPAFYEQYTGLDAFRDISILKSGKPSDNEIVAISGATITSTAVTRAVKAAGEILDNYLNETIPYVEGGSNEN